MILLVELQQLGFEMKTALSHGEGKESTEAREMSKARQYWRGRQGVRQRKGKSTSTCNGLEGPQVLKLCVIPQQKGNIIYQGGLKAGLSKRHQNFC